MSEGSLARLETAVEDRGNHHLVSARGRLTIDTSPALLEVFRKVLKRTAKLKVDLREVAYVDSSGISVLIQGLKMAQGRSVGYVLLDPSPKVRAVLELSQLQGFFTIETTPGA